jgi:hypothetical protein
VWLKGSGVAGGEAAFVLIKVWRLLMPRPCRPLIDPITAGDRATPVYRNQTAKPDVPNSHEEWLVARSGTTLAEA